MKGTIELLNSIIIDNKKVKKLKYDTNEITPELYTKAESLKQGNSSKGNRAGAYELDYSFHLYIGVAAVVAANPDYTFEDVLRIKGRDLIDITDIGRAFCMKSEKLTVGDSDEQSETSPESTTPASQSSKEDQ